MWYLARPGPDPRCLVHQEVCWSRRDHLIDQEGGKKKVRNCFSMLQRPERGMTKQGNRRSTACARVSLRPLNAAHRMVWTLPSGSCASILRIIPQPKTARACALLDESGQKRGL